MNAIYAVGLFMLLGLLSGLLLVWLSNLVQQQAPNKQTDLAEEINNLLPQTQCGQCGYAGCKPYAKAIEQGDDINKCPPGGDSCIQALADLLGVKAIPLDANLNAQDCNIAKVAVIREAECIGCTKCIQACPVDAILGAAKFMHTVLEDECTGCDLCVAPCPVDCIEIQHRPLAEHLLHWHNQRPNLIVTDAIKRAS